MKYISFSGVDASSLCDALNEFVREGGTIENIAAFSVSNMASAIVYGAEPEEEEE